MCQFVLVYHIKSPIKYIYTFGCNMTNCGNTGTVSSTSASDVVLLCLHTFCHSVRFHGQNFWPCCSNDHSYASLTLSFKPNTLPEQEMAAEIYPFLFEKLNEDDAPVTEILSKMMDIIVALIDIALV